MAKFALIDTANCYARARHIAAKMDDWQKIGMAIHLTLSSVNTVVRKFDIDHVIFALEGRSWRKDIYKPYKAGRAVARTLLTEEEREEDRKFWDSYSEFTEFLKTKTNCSVIRHERVEADDIIARFIQNHPTDEHWIISSDTDYYQLINTKVKQFNGITGQLITLDGIFEENGKPVVDKKTGAAKTIGDPNWVLFEKIVRGDPGDGVMSAYPGVRTIGSKNKVGLKEAWEDKSRGGFHWNNLMLQRWTDPDGVEHVVRDDYERNRLLIDLSAQPEDIKVALDDAINSSIKREWVGQVGIHFLKFCGKMELNRIAENSDQYIRWLNAPYKEKNSEN